MASLAVARRLRVLGSIRLYFLARWWWCCRCGYRDDGFDRHDDAYCDYRARFDYCFLQPYLYLAQQPRRFACADLLIIARLVITTALVVGDDHHRHDARYCSVVYVVYLALAALAHH